MGHLNWKPITPEEENVLDQLRMKLAGVCGITLQGTYLTLRWNDKNNKLLSASMTINEVTTPSELRNREERQERMKELIKQYPDLQAELYFVETGEYPK